MDKIKMLGTGAAMVLAATMAINAACAQTAGVPTASSPTASAPTAGAQSAGAQTTADPSTTPESPAAAAQPMDSAASSNATTSATSTGTTATASATPQVKAGAQVIDAQGTPVGTVEKVEGGLATVSTPAAHRARLPLSSFAQRDGALVVSVTAAQIDKAGG